MLVSQHTSPDSPGQWQERHIGSLTGTAGSERSEAGGGEVEAEGTAALQQNTHSTLSVVMRREEASKAEVSCGDRQLVMYNNIIVCYLPFFLRRLQRLRPSSI